MTQKRKNFRDEALTTRDLILEIAEQEIKEKGVEGLRLKSIADQVGVQLPSLYAHFKGRKELLEALGEKLFDQLLKVNDFVKGLPPREALLASSEKLIDFYFERPAYARLLMFDFPASRENSIFVAHKGKLIELEAKIQKTIDAGVIQKTVRPITAKRFLAFRLGVTVLPMFAWASVFPKNSVVSTESLDELKRDAHRMLAAYLQPV